MDVMYLPDNKWGPKHGKINSGLTVLNRHFARVRTDREIQGFSHKRAELLRNRKQRMKTVREGNIREDNIWGKDKNKQEKVRG